MIKRRVNVDFDWQPKEDNIWILGKDSDCTYSAPFFPDLFNKVVQPPSYEALSVTTEDDSTVVYFKDIPGVTRDNVTAHIEDDTLVIKTKRTAGLLKGTDSIEEEIHFRLPKDLDHSPKVFITDGILYFSFSKVKLKSRVDLNVD